LRGVVPDAIGAARKGFDLGNAIRNAPLLRKQREQALAAGEQQAQIRGQQIATGEIDAGKALAIGAFSVSPNEPITSENFLDNIRRMEAKGIQTGFDGTFDDEDVGDLESLRLDGGRLAQASRGGLASATTTTTWNNGTTLFNLPNGSQKLVFQGQDITDPDEIAKTIKEANASGLALAGERARIIAVNAEGGKIEGEIEGLEDTKKVILEKGKATTEVSADKIKSDARAEDLAETNTKLRFAESDMPNLRTIIVELNALTEATFTIKGKLWNTIVRETGFEPTEGATQRVEGLSIINNQVLPKLRQMLGPAFTENEGKRVLALYGDADSHPKERQAALKGLLKAAELEIIRLKRHKRSFSKKEEASGKESARSKLDALRARQSGNR